MEKYIKAEPLKKKIAATPYLQKYPNIVRLTLEHIDEEPETSLSEREQDLKRERDDMTQLYRLSQDKVQSLARELRMYEETVDAIGG